MIPTAVGGYDQNQIKLNKGVNYILNKTALYFGSVQM